MRIFFAFILVLLLARCNKPDAPDCFQSKGKTITETIELSAVFHSIILYDNIKLVLSNDTNSAAGICITGAENLIPDIDFTIYNGVLTIENLNTCNWVRSYNDFTISMNKHDLEHIFNYGSEGLDINYTADTLTIEQENSLADNVINFEGEFLEVNLHTSSGFSRITGSADKAQLYCNGYSSMTTNGLDVTNVVANNSGAGAMYITPSETLIAFLSGSGNIIYSDSTVQLTTQITGTGEVLLSNN